MDTVSEFNAGWEASLDGLNAELWRHMKAAGVTAGWEDPYNGREVDMYEELNGQRRQVQASELFEFVVTYQGERLVQRARHLVDQDSAVIVGLIAAADKLEARGIRVLPY